MWKSILKDNKISKMSNWDKEKKKWETHFISSAL